MGVSLIFIKSTKIADKKLTTLLLTPKCIPHTKYSVKSFTIRDYMTIS